MVLLPTFNGMDADAVPEGTVVLFTVTVEVGSWVTGVTLTVLTVLPTVAV